MRSDTNTLSPLMNMLRAVRRRIVLVAAIVLLTNALGLAAIWRLARTYTATALLLVQAQRQEEDATPNLLTLQAIERRSETIAQLATLLSTLDEARRAANLPSDAYQLQRNVTARPVARTELLRVTATDATPEGARVIANAVANAVVTRMAELEGAHPTGTTVRLAEEAHRPPIPSSTPRRVQATAVLLLSIFLALASARVRDTVDRRVEEEEDVASELHLPIVGSMTRFRRLPKGGYDPRSLDSLRELQSSLRLLKRVEPRHAIAVTSTLAGEGKTTMLANLALAFHDVGDEVVLADLDFLQPGLHRIFRVTVPPLTLARALLTGGAIPDPVPTAYERISLYPATEMSSSEAARVYQSPRLSEITRAPRATSAPSAGPRRWLLVDLPPLRLAPGSSTTAAVFRNVLFVVELSRPRMRDAKETLDLLQRADANVMGAVITKEGAPPADAYGDPPGSAAEKPPPRHQNSSATTPRP